MRNTRNSLRALGMGSIKHIVVGQNNGQPVKLGDLTRGELRKYVHDLLLYQNMLTGKLNEVYETYSNHIASIDAYGEQ